MKRERSNILRKAAENPYTLGILGTHSMRDRGARTCCVYYAKKADVVNIFSSRGAEEKNVLCCTEEIKGIEHTFTFFIVYTLVRIVYVCNTRMKHAILSKDSFFTVEWVVEVHTVFYQRIWLHCVSHIKRKTKPFVSRWEGKSGNFFIELRLNEAR